MANKNYNTSSNPFKISNAKSLAVAAAMPIVAVPIQDVQLLDYAVAHEKVNSTYGLTASTEDTYLGLLDKDPYTSDQQRQRDKYELNDTDLYSVSLEQIEGTSKCHFALHDEWIQKQGYEIDKVVILNLPEQGINGPFRITAIKHALPQKKPEADSGEGYDWKPVTALFEHQSNQVYTIDFDNGESLGVTYQHPIFSTTANDWKLAGELEIGEKVLTKSGNTKVVSSTKKEGSETVYNLEVKELHNFLVGDVGVVVHNGYIIKECFDAVVDYLKTNVKYVGTLGKYGKNGSITGGHHPLAGKLFEADPKYVYDDALSVSKSTLEQIGGTGVHATITGKQKAGYNAWRAANPSPAKLTFADVIEIERQAMIQSGIPEDVANGCIIKGVEGLKKQVVNEITNIPWNGLNN